jgi:serine/threonine protein kinase
MHPGAVLVLAQDLLRGLVELHTLGITMADLKPDNVLLNEGGTPLLCDFGISCAITTHTMCHANTSIKGTFNYMCVGMAGWEHLTGLANGITGYALICQVICVACRAPEQFEEGVRLTPQADMWALGGTLLHALTGRPPWAGSNVMQIATAVGVDVQEGLQIEGRHRCPSADACRTGRTLWRRQRPLQQTSCNCFRDHNCYTAEHLFRGSAARQFSICIQHLHSDLCNR